MLKCNFFAFFYGNLGSSMSEFCVSTDPYSWAHYLALYWDIINGWSYGITCRCPFKFNILDSPRNPGCFTLPLKKNCSTPMHLYDWTLSHPWWGHHVQHGVQPQQLRQLLNLKFWFWKIEQIADDIMTSIAWQTCVELTICYCKIDAEKGIMILEKHKSSAQSRLWNKRPLSNNRFDCWEGMFQTIIFKRKS